jgi:hypothetical protein
MLQSSPRWTRAKDETAVRFALYFDITLFHLKQKSCSSSFPRPPVCFRSPKNALWRSIASRTENAERIDDK